MKSNIKEILKKSKMLVRAVYYVRRFKVYFFCKIQFAFLMRDRFLVSLGKKKQDSRFNQIKKKHNQYRGKRCFIIGNGPSVQLEDLEKLKNEFTFAANKMLDMLQNEEVDYRPTFYVICDTGAYYRLRDKFGLLKSDQIYVGARPMKGCIKTALDLDEIKDEHFNVIPVDCADIWYDICYRPEKLDLGFSDDCSLIVRAGATTLYSMVQLAAYMGFSEIYLYGVECNYNEKKSHFYAEEKGDAHVYTKANTLKMNNTHIRTWKFVKKYADERNLKIYNSSRGGKLEIFPRVDFDSLFI